MTDTLETQFASRFEQLIEEEELSRTLHLYLIQAL
jgi:hypothetical protein